MELSLVQLLTYLLLCVLLFVLVLLFLLLVFLFFMQLIFIFIKYTNESFYMFWSSYCINFTKIEALLLAL